MGGEGVVDRALSDDNDGSRHQRFILRLASGQTLLIAHNIDISLRIQAWPAVIASPFMVNTNGILRVASSIGHTVTQMGSTSRDG